MARALGQQLGFGSRALYRLLRRALRALLVAFGCAGPPMPPHEIRGRTPAVHHEAGARRQQGE